MMKQKSIRLFFALLCAGLLCAPTATAELQQDVTFRLMQLENRVNQLQQRVEYLDRNQQNLTLNTDRSANYELLLEMQRQQLVLAQQVIEQQKRVLELQKALDRLAEQTGHKPVEAPTTKPEGNTPKPPARKP